MSDRQDAQAERKEGFVQAGAAIEKLAEQDSAPPQDRPVLSAALGNVVLTEHGAEVTFVFPSEVVFIDHGES